MSSTISGARRGNVAYTAALYTYLSMASVMYIIRSVQYFVISVYSLELVEKNVTL